MVSVIVVFGFCLWVALLVSSVKRRRGAHQRGILTGAASLSAFLNAPHRTRASR